MARASASDDRLSDRESASVLAEFHTLLSPSARPNNGRTDGRTDGRTETETGGLNCRWDSFLPPPSSSRCRSRRRTDGRRRGRRERSKVLSLFLSIYLVRALLVFWALCTSSIPHLLNLSEADDGYDGTLSVIRWRHIQRRNPGRRGKSSGWRWRG